MNYAFHIDLGDMPYEKWHAMYSAPENQTKRADWWGLMWGQIIAHPTYHCFTYIN
jgi:hypothetical protein